MKGPACTHPLSLRSLAARCNSSVFIVITNLCKHARKIRNNFIIRVTSWVCARRVRACITCGWLVGWLAAASCTAQRNCSRGWNFLRLGRVPGGGLEFACCWGLAAPEQQDKIATAPAEGESLARSLSLSDIKKIHTPRLFLSLTVVTRLFCRRLRP